MEQVLDRIDTERAWAGSAVTLLLALVGGALLFPRRVYDEFVWQYLWGPVYADAHNASCAVNRGGSVDLLSGGACRTATGILAEPGYTVVSEVVYMVTLLYMLVGVLLLMRRLDVGTDRNLFYALVPFVFLGGALRTVEDSQVAAAASGADPAIAYPLSTLLISPLIYGTVFVLTVVALVASRWAASAGYVERYEYALGATGTVALLATVGYLFALAVTTDYVSLLPQFTVATIGIATLTAGVAWVLVQRYAPAINRGTGYVGLVVVWGHAVDGVANVLGLDWGAELGYPAGDLVSKHPVNEAVVDVTASVLPPSVAHYTGTAWPFLLLKLVVAVLVVWVFDERIFEESPRYTVLLLVAILAVGLGPGTRDMLRATFGI